MSQLSRPLGLYLAEAAGRAFDWPTANCAHFAAGWAIALGHADPMRELQPLTDPRAALRLYAEHGGIERVISHCLRDAADPVPVLYAQVGDIVLRPGDHTGALLGICAGMTAVHRDEHGAIVHEPMSGCTHAWRPRT